MTVRIDRARFGPWAMVTGASSGIGKEFATQIAASNINLVLVARREDLLKDLGSELTAKFKIEHRILVADLSKDNAIDKLAQGTVDLDLGLIVSNAGTANPGTFLKLDRTILVDTLKLNTLAHMEIAHHFGKRLALRKCGGLLFVGAMGAPIGIPYLANDAGAKAYVQSFSQAIHEEFSPLGINVTVLPVGPTETPVLDKFGMTPDMMPMKPMKSEQCVSEGLQALLDNQSVWIPGQMNRIMNKLVPAGLTRSMMGKMFRKLEMKKAKV